MRAFILRFILIAVAASTTANAVPFREHPHDWSTEVSLANSAFTLELDDTAFTVQGDESDPGRILIEVEGNENPVTYRLWPDIARWQLSEEGAAIYSKEFEEIQGWQGRSIQIDVDAHHSIRRVWVDGRLVKAWRSSAKHPRLVAAGSEQIIPTKDHPGNNSDTSFLQFSLEPYFNDFPSGTAPERANLDLGKTAYRTAHIRTGPTQAMSTAYINCDAMASDPKRAIFRVPARFYDRIHLLAYADEDATEVPRAAVRFMQVARARFLTREFGLEPAKGVHILGSRDVGGKQCAHIAVDLNPAAFQEFLTESNNDYLEFELTRPVVMDSSTFEHPAGPPSSLHILALALEVAPVTMTVDSDIPGHLFEHTDDAIMHVSLASNREVIVAGTVRTRAIAPNGQSRDQRIPFELAPGAKQTIDIDVNNAQAGKHEFTATLDVHEAAGAKRSMQRQTSFAILPEFIRTAKESPFGMWSFFNLHHGASVETTSEMLRKLGVRGTLTNFILGTDPSTWEENARRTAILRAHNIEPNWGHLAGIAQTSLDGLGDLDAKFAWVEAHPQVKDYNLFWETRVKKRAVTTCPPEIRGRPPIEWDTEEQQRIDTFMTFGKTWAERARSDAPNIRLSFGNGFPLFTSAMLRAGFPHEYIDMLGLDFDMYTSAPEDQPSMWYAPFSGIYYLRELRKLYGYEDKPLSLTEAIYCPTSPIWLTEREQADYYVRAHLVAMAMGVEKFGMCGNLIDPDGWFHYGHYGPVGLSHAAPELNPREAYCAYATMTGLLDNAQLDTVMDLGSPHAYGLRFRKNDDSYVYAFWTVNGSRILRLQIGDDGDPTVYNRDGNDITTQSTAPRPDEQTTQITLQLDESPQYLKSPTQIEAIALGSSDPILGPNDAQPLVRFDSLEDWQRTDKPLAGYEDINPATPVAWVNLDLTIENDALRVRPPNPADTHPLETLCMTLRYTGTPLEIPEQAKAIGVHARSDRAWGRVVFILEDKAGKRWTSAYSQTPIDVDGEIYLETALPTPPSADYPGYKNYRPWRRGSGATIPEYPLRLVGLLLETRTHAIHGPDLVRLADTGFELQSISLR
jgi:hypothetical protein